MWKTVKLGNVAQVIAGQSPSGEHYNNEGCGTPFYQGKKDYGERYLNPPKVWTISVTKLAEKNDILISVRAPVGALNIVTERVCIGRGLAAIRPNSSISMDYLYYVLSLISVNLRGNAGAIFESINKKQIEDIEFVLPPLAEQQRIVEKLDRAFVEIDAAVMLKNKKSKEIEQLEKNLISKMFDGDFPLMKLDELGSVQSGGTPKSTNKSYWNGEISWYSSGELNEMYALPSVKKITDEGLNGSNAKIFMKGSLLIGMYDTAAMKMSILRTEAAFNQAIAAIPVNDIVTSEYLYFVLTNLKDKILLGRRGTRQQNLSLEKIKEIKIPIPNKNTQEEIVRKLVEIKSLAFKSNSINGECLSKFSHLKSAILKHALQPPQQ